MWILQYAYSRSVNRRHHLENRQFYTRLDLNEIDTENCPTGSASGSALSPGETGRLVEQALDHLRPEQREAIELVYFEGRTFPEAAEATGRTLQALRHHYYRGLIKIREFIESAGSPGEEKPAIPLAERMRLEVANAKARTI